MSHRENGQALDLASTSSSSFSLTIDSSFRDSRSSSFSSLYSEESQPFLASDGRSFDTESTGKDGNMMLRTYSDRYYVNSYNIEDHGISFFEVTRLCYRFIPTRSNDMQFEFQRRLAASEEQNSSKRKGDFLENKRKKQLLEENRVREFIIQKTMFPQKSNMEMVESVDPQSSSPSQNLLRFRSSLPKRPHVFDTPLREVYSTTPFSREVEGLMIMPRETERTIDDSPFQMLAFCHELRLKDDFYLNVVDWSCSNMLSLGLESCVYLWNIETSKMTKLCDLGGSHLISSVRWLPQESQLAIGTAEGKVQLWDACKLMKIREMGNHQSRVGAAAWNGKLLSTGSADRYIFHRDPRSPHDIFRVLTGHKSEICGLKWNHEGDQLASGGNSRELFIWEGNNCYPAYKLGEHKAAVRALSWSPHSRNLLASGGGHRDRRICFWNTLNARCLTSYNVCNLQWSPSANEIVSTHGWWKNDVIVWKYPSMEKLSTLKGHTFRVLYFALSPNGEDIVTGAGSDDSTLRFWKVFNTPVKKKKEIRSALKLDGMIR
ncbi:1376_t:CDS:2 [Acaulospora morrowiae]|uniref:1376_t:CDS:1 n=1 Tax=Acaulospora morrowiae TaxID=94023 RepID=A0A9N8ZVL7_9GLOM|nr:1376_t:CDS:2 [Acaulospora morrowiae]